jgi:hypothetical protein
VQYGDRTAPQAAARPCHLGQFSGRLTHVCRILDAAHRQLIYRLIEIFTLPALTFAKMTFRWAARRAAELPDVQEMLRRLVSEPGGDTPDEFASHMREDIADDKHVAAKIGNVPQ